MLEYFDRFYQRQFITRSKLHSDLVQRFERSLVEYFQSDLPSREGLPGVRYFADQLNISPTYLTDLLKKFTGKNTQEHIHLQLVERAKNQLLSTTKPISEIAYELGFEHPSHFTKIFKGKKNLSPGAFRSQN